MARIDTQVYKINPLIAESQREEENEGQSVENEDTLVVDTSQLRYGYAGATPEKAEMKPMESTKWRSGESRNESSNVLPVRHTSNVAYSKRNKKERKKSDQSVKKSDRSVPPPVARRKMSTDKILAELPEVPYNDLRARLRKTGQIEQNSGLHKIEIARKHSQRAVINVK